MKAILVILLRYWEKCADFTKILRRNTNVITEIIFRIIIEHFYCVYYLLGVVFLCEMQV